MGWGEQVRKVVLRLHFSFCGPSLRGGGAARCANVPHIHPKAKDTQRLYTQLQKNKKTKPFPNEPSSSPAHTNARSRPPEALFSPTIFPRLASRFEEKEKSTPPDLSWQLDLSDCKSEISLIHLAKLQKKAFFFLYICLAAPLKSPGRSRGRNRGSKPS